MTAPFRMQGHLRHDDESQERMERVDISASYGFVVAAHDNDGSMNVMAYSLWPADEMVRDHFAAAVLHGIMQGGQLPEAMVLSAFRPPRAKASNTEGMRPERELAAGILTVAAAGRMSAGQTRALWHYVFYQAQLMSEAPDPSELRRLLEDGLRGIASFHIDEEE